jgi:hypothetical protein
LLWIQLSMSIGQASALGENGHSVFGVGENTKGCVGANFRNKAGRVVRQRARKSHPRFCSGFCYPACASALSSSDCLTASQRGDRSIPRACRKLPGAMRSSCTTRRRHIHPIKATVMTETPSGVNRNTNNIIGINCQHIFS